MNYKKYFLATVIIASFETGLIQAGNTIAVKAHEKHAPTNVVVIDGEAIIKTSERGRALHENLTKKQEILAAPLKKEEAEIQNSQKTFESNKKTFETSVLKLQGKESELLSPEAKEQQVEKLQKEQQKLEELQVQIQQKVKQFQANATRIEQKINAEYQKEMDAFDKSIKEVIEAAAVREKWDIVLMQVVYAHPSKDVTKIVIDDLNKAYKPINENTSKKAAIKS